MHKNRDKNATNKTSITLPCNFIYSVECSFKEKLFKLPLHFKPPNKFKTLESP